MNPKDTRKIFVTGLPRSGTTFVGQILSSPSEVDYIHEPFNPRVGIRGLGIDTYYVRPSLESEEEKRIDGFVQRVLRYDYKTAKFVDKNDPLFRRTVKRIVGGRGAVYLKLARANRNREVSLIKDPTAPLMAHYLSTRYNCRTVLVVKHPLSYFASLRRVKWRPYPPMLLKQQQLVEDFFKGDGAPDIEPWMRQEKWSDPVLAAGVQWAIVHHVLLEQAKEHRDWIIIRHEDLSLRPVETFRTMFGDLDLAWSDSIEAKIRKLTGGGGTEARTGKVQDFKRQSDKIFHARVESIEPVDRRRIYEVTKSVATRLYDESTFALETATPAS